jgi:hypothetical protein
MDLVNSLRLTAEVLIEERISLSVRLVAIDQVNGFLDTRYEIPADTAEAVAGCVELADELEERAATAVSGWLFEYYCKGGPRGLTGALFLM